MTIRHATADDSSALRGLWERWQAESVAPPWADASWEANRARVRARARRERALPRRGGRRAGRLRHRLARGSRRQDRRSLRQRRRRGDSGTGGALVETVVENLARPRRDAPVPRRRTCDALAFYEKLGFREESRNLVLAARGARGRRDGPSFGSIHVQSRRSRRGRACRPAVRAAAAGRVARKQRHAAAQRLDRRLRRCLRPRPVDAAPAREGAVGTYRRRRDRDRRRARAGRPLRPASRRAASSTSTSPCRSTTVRCRRATRSRSPRTRGSSRDSRAPIPPLSAPRPERRRARRAAARAGAAGGDRGRDRARGRRARLGGCA